MEILKPSSTFSKFKRDILTAYSINDQWPEVYPAPEPSVILWRNLSVGPVNRFIRTIIVSIVTIILLAISIFCIVVAKYYQDKYSAQYNLNNCGNIQVTQTQAFIDY